MRLVGHSLAVESVSRRRSSQTTLRSPLSLIAAHGYHSSFPVFTPAGQGPCVDTGLAQFRFVGCDEGSSFTRVGPTHVEPPSVDLNSKTSVFELATVPFRLSDITRYRSSAYAPPRGSTTTLPPALTRKHELVSTARPELWPRATQSARPRVPRG